MRAMTITRFGEPDVLKMAEMPEPAVGENDLLIEVHAAGLNPVDTKIRRGMHGEKALPLIPGYDVSGVVQGMGAKVDRERFKVGDEVYASPSLARHGSHAERVAVDARSAAHKPRTLGHVETAALPLVTLTAWEALYDRARVRSGETVLIHAGAGGVGHVAIQLAKRADCTVWTTASRAESIALCKEVGADVVIDHKKEKWVERVTAETGGKGLAVIFDTVGDPVFDQCLDAIAVNGRLVTIVLNQNPRVVPALFRKNVTLHLEFMGIPTVHGINPGHQGEILAEAATMTDEGKLRPHVHKVIGLEELPAAHAEQQGGKVMGKIVVRVRG